MVQNAHGMHRTTQNVQWVAVFLEAWVALKHICGKLVPKCLESLEYAVENLDGETETLQQAGCALSRE